MNHSRHGQDATGTPERPTEGKVMQLEFESSLVNVDRAAAAVRDWCESHGWSADVIGQIELVLVEALTNVIVHAYDKLDGQPISLDWWRQDHQMLIEIRDKGQPITEVPVGELPDPEAESGRGWYIIRALADTVVYRREAEENILLLGKSVTSD